MKLFNIIILRLTGIIVLSLGIVNTILIEKEIHLSTMLIGLVFILLSFEKEDKIVHKKGDKRK